MRGQGSTEIRHAIVVFTAVVSVLLAPATSAVALLALEDGVHRLAVRSCEGGGFDLVLAHEDEPGHDGPERPEATVGMPHAGGPLHADHVIRCAQDLPEAAVRADAPHHAAAVHATERIASPVSAPLRVGLRGRLVPHHPVHASTTVLRI